MKLFLILLINEVWNWEWIEAEDEFKGEWDEWDDYEGYGGGEGLIGDYDE